MFGAPSHLEALIFVKSVDPNFLSGTASPGGAQLPTVAANEEGTVTLEEQPVARPMRLADIIMPRPHRVRGVTQGLEVFPGERAAAFYEIGLKPGDVVIEFNGRPISSNEDAGLFQSGATDASFVLTIERRGQRQSIQIVNGKAAFKAVARPST